MSTAFQDSFQDTLDNTINMSNINPSDRLASIPEYTFGKLDAIKLKLTQAGKEVLDFSLGSPDRPTPPEVVDAMYKSMQERRSQQYPIFNGKPELKDAIAKWMKHRFNVTLKNPQDQVLPLIGSKEGIGHLAFAYINPGDVTIAPSPYYPVHLRGTMLAGGEAYELPLKAENNFIGDLDSIPEDILKRAKIMIMSYPNNPTGSIVDKAYMEKAVKLCKKHGILLLNDFAYSEIWFDEKPPSIFEIEGAWDTAIEFQSFSKTYNMAGMRIGFAVGNEELIHNLYKIKINLDYGVCMGIQDAGVAALNLGDDFREEQRLEYKKRAEYVYNALKEMGFKVLKPGGAMYVWGAIPEGFKDCTEYTMQVLEKTGVALVPGVTFGTYGEGYFRVALIQPMDVIEKAMERLRNSELVPNN